MALRREFPCDNIHTEDHDALHAHYNNHMDVDDHGGDPTGATSSSTAITATITALGADGGEIRFGEGTYLITESMAPGIAKIDIRGKGMATQIKWGGGFTDDAKMIKLDAGGNTALQCGIFDLWLHGNDLALWGIWCDYPTHTSRIDGVYISNVVGYIYCQNSWFLDVGQLTGYYAVDGVPGESAVQADIDRWATVHNTTGMGQVVFEDCHSARFGNLNFQNCGVTTANIPAGQTKTLNCVYMEGVGFEVDVISIGVRGTDTVSTDGCETQLRVEAGQASFGTLHFEVARCDHLVSIYDQWAANFGRIFVKGGIWDHWIECEAHGDDEVSFLHVQAVDAYEVYVGASKSLIYSAAGHTKVILDHADVHLGDTTHTDPATGWCYDGGADIVGMFGLQSAGGTIELPIPQSIARIAGFGTHDDSDGDGDYLMVGYGILRVDGQTVSIGKEERFGWTYRAAAGAADAYYVWVDVYGSFWVDTGPANTRLGGRVLVATFDQDADGNISNVVNATMPAGPVITKSANYTLGMWDEAVIASGSGTVITAPENAPSGKPYTIKRVDASNAQVVSRETADTIDGATSKSLDTDYAFVVVVSDGANYHIVGQGGTIS